jgi:hypothetical protein
MSDILLHMGGKEAQLGKIMKSSIYIQQYPTLKSETQRKL